MQKIYLVLLFFCFYEISFAQVGVNTTDPKTTLDVNGAITNREVSFTIASNAVNIATETSLARIIGTATATISITAYSPLTNGHRLIIHNNTVGGFMATFYGYQIPNGQAVEFIYTNSVWKSNSGSIVPGGTDWTINGNSGTTAGTHFIGTTDATDLVVKTNATEKIRLLSNGRVGIGTPTPSLRLDVLGNLGLKLVSNWDHFFIDHDGWGPSIYAGGADHGLQFKVGAGTSGTYGDPTQNYVTGMTIMPSGNVGIGTTNPLNLFDVSYGARTGTHGSGLPFYATGNIFSNVGGFEFRHSSGTQGIGLGYNTIYATGSDAIQNLSLESRGTGNLGFNTNSLQRMIVLGNGNVGVGTTNPSKKFTVENGSIRPAVGNNEDAGVYFPINPGGGFNDEAFIRYYVESGENTKLLIGINDNPEDDIAFYQAGAERMNIYNGNVGIGITTPTQRLDVQGGNARLNNAIVGDFGFGFNWGGIAHQSQANTTGYGLIQSSDGNYTLINKENTGAGYIGFRVGNTDRAVILNNGNVGLGTNSPWTALTMGGGAYCDSFTWVNASDARLKDNIKPMNQYGLAQVLQLKPVTYYYKKDTTKHQEVGFIAQDVKKVIPEVVTGSEGDIEKGETLGLSYGNLVPVLTKAIQEQQVIIEELKKKIEVLEKKIK